jgi:glutaconate CoA-transferase subunit B
LKRPQVTDMENAYSVRELMAVVLARDLEDGDQLQVGVAMPIVELAVRLAHVTHGPNMELIFFGARMNVHHIDTVPVPAFPWDQRVVRWSESYSDRGHRFEQLKDWGRRVFFIGGIQVDQYGNTNLIGIGKDFKKLRFRGPGSVGTPTLSTHVGRYYIVLNDHTARTLVERCDYRSTVGWDAGGADARTRLGIPGGGPKWCVTPLCVMDFAPDSKRMRLKSVHPGVSVDTVRKNTGFALDITEPVAITTPPTADELETLRTRVDPAGVLLNAS